MFVAKGLDFPHVFLMRLECMPTHLASNLDEQLRLLYVAMTRAMQTLTLSCVGAPADDSSLVQRVQGALDELQAQMDQTHAAHAP